MDEPTQQLWQRRIRRALFWARVQTVMMAIIAAASLIVAAQVILSWLM